MKTRGQLLFEAYVAAFGSWAGFTDWDIVALHPTTVERFERMADVYGSARFDQRYTSEDEPAASIEAEPLLTKPQHSGGSTNTFTVEKCGTCGKFKPSSWVVFHDGCMCTEARKAEGGAGK